MTQVIEITATWRKTKQGEWVAFGNATELNNALDNDLPVTIIKRDGTRQERTVTRVGKSFQVDGKDMAYGYLAPESRRRVPGYVALANATRPMSGSGRSLNRSSGRCDECGRNARMLVPASDMSGIPGMVCMSCKADEGTLSFC